MIPREQRSLARRALARGQRRLRARRTQAVAVRTLVGSRLFDERWYSHCAGETMDKKTAARHYLSEGRARQWTPHPLVDPDWFAARRPDLVTGDEDPFLAYLRGRHFGEPAHPLFMVRRYAEANPEAVNHPEGPVGHYLEVGAAQGASVNEWYRPDPGREPRGLVDWLWEQVSRWHEAEQDAPALWGDRAPAPGEQPTGHGGEELVSVVLVADDATEAVRVTLEDVLAQEGAKVEVLVCPVEGAGSEPLAMSDPRVRRLPPATDRWAALSMAAMQVSGTWVAHAVAGDRWESRRLARLVAGVRTAGASWGHDVVEEREGESVRFVVSPATRATAQRGEDVPLGMLLVDAQLARRTPFDRDLHHAAVLDVVVRLARVSAPAFVPEVGVRSDRGARLERLQRPPDRRPWLDHDLVVVGLREAALNRHLVDWDHLAARELDNTLTTVVVVATGPDHLMTRRAVTRLVEVARDEGERVEVVVVDNGCRQLTSVALSSLQAQFAEVRVVRSRVDRGPAMGSNLGLADARGAVVVFLGHDTEVTPGWLALLLAPLSAPEVAATQSLLLHKDGSVRSAGVAFPPGRGVPHALLRGFPREDATGVDGHPLHGLSGAALAVRRDDLVRLRGFDPTFRNDMADVDLCLRLTALRPGRLLTVPGSRVIQHGPRRGRGSAQQVIDRKVFLDRWHARLPVDDAAAWGAAGYRVVGREIREHLSRDKRVCAVEPVVQRLRRPDPLTVVESPPCLRWALKQAAPFGRVGAKWGDTHFCQLLAEALRRHGQEVVVDHRPAFDRPSIRHDDVTLLLRGLAPYTPHPEHVNLMWVISHPELLEDAEAPGWDQVYVASTTHAATLAERWPVPVAALLQATDPKRFHPDRAEPDSGFPLLFVGNSRRQRRPMVVGALDRGLPLTLVGGDWQGIVAEDQVQAAYLDHDVLGAAYRSAGIVLGDHWEDMRRLGFLSNRLFDAVASGARVITDDVAGLRDVFDDHVRVARDADELVRLVDEPDRDRLFGTDDERRAAAARVAAEHSFDARAGLLVDRAVELWRKRGQGR